MGRKCIFCGKVKGYFLLRSRKPWTVTGEKLELPASYCFNCINEQHLAYLEPVWETFTDEEESLLKELMSLSLPKERLW